VKNIIEMCSICGLVVVSVYARGHDVLSGQAQLTVACSGFAQSLTETYKLSFRSEAELLVEIHLQRMGCSKIHGLGKIMMFHISV
jgi:hypothetical protein